jgi:hypothetical protein
VTRPSQADVPKDSLERGEIDFAIAGFFGHLFEGKVSQSLFSKN